MVGQQMRAPKPVYNVKAPHVAHKEAKRPQAGTNETTETAKPTGIALDMAGSNDGTDDEFEKY